MFAVERKFGLIGLIFDQHLKLWAVIIGVAFAPCCFKPAPRWGSLVPTVSQFSCGRALGNATFVMAWLRNHLHVCFSSAFIAAQLVTKMSVRAAVQATVAASYAVVFRRAGTAVQVGFCAGDGH